MFYRGWVSFFLLVLSIVALGRPSGERFQQSYQAARAGYRPQIDPASLQPFDYLFFAGLGGEKYRPFEWIGDGYFQTFHRVVAAQGIPKPQIIPTFYPPSAQTISHNAEHFLSEKLEAQWAKSGRKQVIFGHSKGGAELFLFALSHPEWLRDRIEAVILISGAIQGSALANLITGRPVGKVPRHIGWPSQLVAALLAPVMNYLYHDGLRSITTYEAEAAAHELARRYPEGMRLLLEKALFIQTSTAGIDRSPLVWLPGAFLQAEGQEPADGLVTLSRQLPPEELLETAPETVVLDGVNHFMPCPSLFSFYLSGRIPRAVAWGALAALTPP